jgi:hypothetical protein
VRTVTIMCGGWRSKGNTSVNPEHDDDGHVHHNHDRLIRSKDNMQDDEHQQRLPLDVQHTKPPNPNYDIKDGHNNYDIKDEHNTTHHFMGRDTREGRGGGTKESESGR